MLGLAHRGFAMTDYRRHILYTLRDAGYRTILGGLQHIAAKPETIGYDDLRRAKSNRVADVAPAARFLNSRPTEPFFLDVGFFETHRAYPAPTADDDPRYIQPPVPMPDTAATRADMAGFHASARILDQGVGHVLDALERSGLGANTLVISTTDHGLAFPDMKCNLLDSGFGVSLIGYRRHGLPTRSLPHYLRHARAETSRVARRQIDAAALTRRDAATPRRNLCPRSTTTPPTNRSAPSARRAGSTSAATARCTRPCCPIATMAQAKASGSSTAGGQCEVGVAADLAPVLADMRTRLDSWMHRTNDPLLKGPVPVPPGAKVNPMDGTSPTEPVIGF